MTNETILEVSDLCTTFTRGDMRLPAIRDVSFSVGKGEVLGLVGESGSGKSVTLRSILGLARHYGDVTGSVRWKGQELTSMSERALRHIRGKEIAMIFQEPMTSLNPLHTIEKQLSESIELHQGLLGGDVRARVLELLEQVGIRDAESRLGSYPHQLSGGQRQRVMIAMALANGPELLIADEPTTALDVTIQAQILDLLADLKRDLGMSMLFITHDLTIVRKIADRVYVMKDGEIVENGPTAEIFDNPQHPYTQTLLEAESTGTPDPVPEEAEEIAAAENLKIWFPIHRGLLKRTVGHVRAVNDASLTVRAGETVGIVGESGSGKTTLALAMMRLISSEGRIVFMRRDIQGLREYQMRPLRSDMQIVFQDPYGSLSPRMTVEQIIAEGLTIHGTEGGKAPRDMVAEIMSEVGLDPSLMDRYPHEFSGGQRQRTAIARAMILRPKLVVLDEPTSALDVSVQAQVLNLLKELQAEFKLTYIFISHDLGVVKFMSDRIMVMNQGKIEEIGSAEDIYKRPRREYTQQLISAIPEGTLERIQTLQHDRERQKALL